MSSLTGAGNTPGTSLEIARRLMAAIQQTTWAMEGMLRSTDVHLPCSVRMEIAIDEMRAALDMARAVENDTDKEED